MIRRLAVGAALVVMAACALLSLVVALPFLAVGYVVDLLRVRRPHPPVDPCAPWLAAGLLSDWVPRTPEEEFADEVEAWLCAQTCDREEF